MENGIAENVDSERSKNNEHWIVQQNFVEGKI